MNLEQYVDNLCELAVEAKLSIANASTQTRNALLKEIATQLKNNQDYILKQNKIDLQKAREKNIGSALYDRLQLNEERIAAMAKSVLEIAEFSDPVRKIENMSVRPSGIRVGQMRIPLGVVMVIFEARPNVITDIAALCLKSGNVSILRGGKEALQTNMALAEIIKKALRKFNFAESTVTFIEQTDHELIPYILKKNEFIDVVIPRGGHNLISLVTRESNIPVLKHDKGLCHLYLDESADLEMAKKIIVNAKVQRPGVCNAAETLLIHKNFSASDEVLAALIEQNVTIYADSKLRNQSSLPLKEATAETWNTEYLDLAISAKLVENLDEAMEHIQKYSSGHSEAIITNDYLNSERFLTEVDSAAVLVNASTRFHDGGEFGLGAEVGISTEKLHARGAMGIEGLTCLKYIVYGTGQIRE